MAPSRNKLIATLASAAMVASLCPVGAAFAADRVVPSGVPAGMHGGVAVLEADAVATVKSLIAALPDSETITAAPMGTYDNQILAVIAAFNALSAQDQAVIDGTSFGGQSYGRQLESAEWAAAAKHEVDNSTTLGNGTYNASTTPALSSEYSKGKSTSPRQRPWHVTDVTVVDGQAFGTVTVESSTYTYIYMSGQRFENVATSGDSTFLNVPIDLNSTQYLTGYSTSMVTEIAFSLTTTIEEPAEEPEPGPGEGDQPGTDPVPGPGEGDRPGTDPVPGPGEGDQPGTDPEPAPQYTTNEIVAMIEALPTDPYVYTIANVIQVHAVQEAFATLSADQQAAVNALVLPRGTTCERALEVAQWAILSLYVTDNSTTLADGVYTLDPDALKTDMGSSASARQNNWSVVKITVSDGHAMATLRRNGGNTPAASVYFEGRVIPCNADGTFTIPFVQNAHLYFATKPATAVASTTGVSYHLDTTIDLSGITPAPLEDPTPAPSPTPGPQEGSDTPVVPVPGSNNTGITTPVAAGGALGGLTSSGKTSSAAKTASAGAETATGSTVAAKSDAQGDDALDGADVSPFAVGGGFAGILALGGGGFAALFRKREQH